MDRERSFACRFHAGEDSAEVQRAEVANGTLPPRVQALAPEISAGSKLRSVRAVSRGEPPWDSLCRDAAWNFQRQPSRQSSRIRARRRPPGAAAAGYSHRIWGLLGREVA